MSSTLTLTSGATASQQAMLAELHSLTTLKSFDTVLHKGAFVLDEACIKPHPDQRPLDEVFVEKLIAKVNNGSLTPNGDNLITVVAQGPMYAGERFKEAAVMSYHPLDAQDDQVQFWVVDGQHRLEALRRAGFTQITVGVYHQGEYSSYFTIQVLILTGS